MPMEANEWNWIAALLVLAEFGCLALLGFLLVQIMHLESNFNNHKEGWLKKIRQTAPQLRQIRRTLDRFDGQWPEIPLTPSLKKKWQVFGWVCKALSASKWARS